MVLHLALLGGALWAAAMPPEALDVSLWAPAHSYDDVLVSIPLPGSLTAEHVSVNEAESGSIVPSQLVVDGTKRSVVVQVDMKREQLLKLRIDEAQTAPAGDYSVRRSPERIELLHKGDLLLGVVLTGEYAPCLYPVIGPTGKKVTRDYPLAKTEGDPTDHPHHRSVWFGHGDINGVDFWLREKDSGKFVIREVVAEGGPLFARVVLDLDLTDAYDEPLLGTRWEIRAFVQDGRRVIDFASTLTADHVPLKFGDTKEGTFALRVAPSMEVDRGKGHIVTSDGHKDADAWGKATPWCDYSGPIAGETVGIAMFSHPENVGHPPRWHVREYGLFAANPFGYKQFGRTPRPFAMLKGASRTFRYRVVLHKGDASSLDLNALYDQYAEPPSVHFPEEQ
jgi:hypothetical protein